MTQSWYEILCPQCGKRGLIQSAQFSADGELRWFIACHKCKTIHKVRITAAALAHHALCLDVEKTQKARGPLQPDQILNQAIGQEIARICDTPQSIVYELELTVEDRSFLHALGVKEE